MLQQAARPPAITTTVHDRIMRAVAAVSAKAVAAAMLRQRSASLRLRQARPRKFDDLRIGSGRRAATGGIATHIVRSRREPRRLVRGSGRYMRMGGCPSCSQSPPGRPAMSLRALLTLAG